MKIKSTITRRIHQGQVPLKMGLYYSTQDVYTHLIDRRIP